MLQDSPYTLNSIRTITNYGLYVTGNTVDPIFTQGKINSKPNVQIQGSTCILDYSHVFDVSEVLYLQKTFGSLTGGNTFSMQDVSYYDEYNNINTVLGGTCNFAYTLNHCKIIVGSKVSGFTESVNYNYYSKQNFLDAPQYNFNPTGGTVGYYLVNSLPNLNKVTFKKMGVVGYAFGFEEYIDISGGTAENSDRIPVYGTVTLKDGQELLYFSSGGTAQNLINSPTTINLYLRGKPSLLTAPYTSDTTGIFTIYNTDDGSLLYCFENQSFNEATLRKNSITPPYVGYFDSCPSCYDLIYGAGIGTPWPTILPEFTNLIYLKIGTSGTNIDVFQSYVSTTSNSLTSVRIPSSSNNILKIDLSHPTLLNYTVQLYYDSGYKIPVGTSFNIYGVPGYNGAYALLNSYVSPSTLYGVLSGKGTLYFTMSV